MTDRGPLVHPRSPRKPFRKRLARLGLIVGPVVLIAAGIFLLGESPPAELFEQARRQLELARAAKATDFAPDRFREAQQKWEEAISAWRSENERAAAFRSFDSVSIRLSAAESAALAAYRQAVSTADSLRRSAERDIERAQSLRGPLEDAASFFPAGFVDRRDLLAGHTALSLAESALDRDDLWKAAASADDARGVYESLTTSARARILPMATNVQEWRRRRDSLVRGKSTPVIVVDKAARRLYLHQGRKVDSFSVELGRRWLGDKRMEGDRATPEGLYRVVRKLDRGQSIYHRALVIDYPNDEDRRRFAREKAAGTLPSGARIGGNIEVHGGGGRDVDWTDGCVALTNREMDAIFAKVPIGTPVLIASTLSSRLPLIDQEEHGTQR